MPFHRWLHRRYSILFDQNVSILYEENNTFRINFREQQLEAKPGKKIAAPAR
jgi:hypothetical protein